MNSIRKWFYKPKKEDQSKLAQFYWADEELNMVATELDSFDGQKDPERCSALVDQLRLCQDKVLGICNGIMDEAIPDLRAYRDFRAKFPDDILQENLAGQLWFGAECLAAGSNLMNRELESASMRPLAKALTKALDHVRWMLREQCIKNPLEYSDKVKEALVIFDRLFAEFEFCYVSALVPVKSAKEYHLQQEVIILFSETLQRALKLGLVTQDMVDDCDPSLMFTIPRLAIVCGLLVYPEGPLNVDRDPSEISELYRPFYNLLFKIRDLLWTLSRVELHVLEKTLCSLEDPQVVIDSETTNSEDYPVPDSEDYIKLFYQNHQNCKQFIHDFYAFNFGSMSSQQQEENMRSMKNKVRNMKSKFLRQTKALEEDDINFSLSDGCLDAKPVIEVNSVSDEATESNANMQDGVVVARRDSSVSNEDIPERTFNQEGEIKTDTLVSAGDFGSLESILNPMPSPDASMDGNEPSGDNEKADLDSSSTEAKSQESVCVVQDIDETADTRTVSGNISSSAYSSVTNEGSLSQTFHLLRTLQPFEDRFEYSSSPEVYSRLLGCPEVSHSFPQPGLQLCYPPDARRNMIRHSLSVKLKERAFPRYYHSRKRPPGVVCRSVYDHNSACCSTEVHLSDAHAQPPSRGMLRHSETRRLDESLSMSSCKTSPRPIPRVQRLRQETRVGASSYSSCSSCQSSSSLLTSDWEPSSGHSSTTSSYKSECQDDEEIALALQAAEIASRNEARARFKNSTDLVHRLFVCISGVADQLQTNYASDLRNILKCVFDMNCSNSSIYSPKKSYSSGTSSSSDSETELQTVVATTTESEDEFCNVSQNSSTDRNDGRQSISPCNNNNNGTSLNDEEPQRYNDMLAREVECGEEAVLDPTLFSDDDGFVYDSPVEERGLHFQQLSECDTCEEPPKWLPDELTAYCMACQSPFTLLRRRHHCRNCGKIFCSRCSSNSIPLPQYGHLKPVRVCNQCFSLQLTPMVVQEQHILA